MENAKVPHFFKEIKERMKLQFYPFNDLYLSYLIFFVLLIGGIGIWVSIAQELRKEVADYSNVALNIGTYYLALITTSYIDITTNDKIVNKKSLQVYSFIFLFVIAAIFVTSFFLVVKYSLLLSAIGIILGLFIWHLANCDNDKFNDESYNAKIRAGAKNTHGKEWK
jgi:uncharacterized membrane protein